MKILVTGGAGNVGQGVVARLVKNGHQVRVIDWRIPERAASAGAEAEYAECDITNFTDLREQARGQDAIIHLAAFPYPAAASGPEMFRVNCAGTYNVFEAAAAEGIRRVACASSINALGYNFGVKGFPIQYFPVDEEHPTFTTDPYSFSKQTTEAIASYYWRRDSISSACMRMPYVYTIREEPDFWTQLFMERYPAFFKQLMDMDEDERLRQVTRMKAGLEEERAKRVWEKPFEDDWDESSLDDPAMMAYFGYTDFWSIISVEDTAQAFEKALLADYEGSHPLFVCEAQNITGIDSGALLRVFYPEVTARKKALQGAETLLSYEKARQLIGYEPEYIMKERLK